MTTHRPPPVDLATGRTLLMAVLNATPDSFSGDGVLDGTDDPGRRVERLLAAGPDLIDVGAESTRPGYVPVPPEVQIERLEPVLATLVAAGRAGAGPVPWSIDTCSAEVARFALDHGASIINDVSGFRRDPAIVDLAAERGVHLVATHSSEDEATLHTDPTLGGGYHSPRPDDAVVADVRDGLSELARRAVEAGVRPDRVVLDPGIGFGKSTEQNLRLLADLPALRTLGHPLLLGPSRKRFIGDLTGRPAPERTAGTCAVVALAAQQGVEVVRVHDVAASRDVLAVTHAILARRPTPSR